MNCHMGSYTNWVNKIFFSLLFGKFTLLSVDIWLTSPFEGAIQKLNPNSWNYIWIDIFLFAFGKDKNNKNSNCFEIDLSLFLNSYREFMLIVSNITWAIPACWSNYWSCKYMFFDQFENMTRGGEYLIGLPKILELPEFNVDRNNRMVLESGALKMIRKVRPGKQSFFLQ